MLKFWGIMAAVVIIVLLAAMFGPKEKKS